MASTVSTGSRTLRFKGHATVSGKGFAIGIKVERAAYAGKIGEACQKNGLLISVEENVLMLFPALTIAPETLERGLAIFERSL